MKSLKFVVQKHDATNLHYDFRLEVNEVMPSWAIPKGPTLDPKIKRLAMKTEDHSLDYRNFEGVIKEGHYGAGTVKIWDKGYYFPQIEENKLLIDVRDFRKANKVMEQGLTKGVLKFHLFGKRLKGSYALVKTSYGPKSWLLIKHKDE